MGTCRVLVCLSFNGNGNLARDVEGCGCLGTKIKVVLRARVSLGQKWTLLNR